MINNVNFSSLSLQRLRSSNISNAGISAFSTILQQAQHSDVSAKQFLSELSSSQLSLVQKANGLVEPININQLSNEGAQNLLSHPDGSDRVDLNNDGIVEVGSTDTLEFPPVNAPQKVKDAWQKATEGLSWSDTSSIGVTMNIMIYGFNINGSPQSRPPTPDEQWSEQGVQQLFNKANSNLDFRVGMEGWTDYNKTLQQVYQKFESALAQTRSIYSVEAEAGSKESADQQYDTDLVSASATADDKQAKLSVINQLILDGRLGIDREKLKQIDIEMERIAEDPNLSEEQKQQMLKALQQEKEAIIKEAADPEREDKKRRAALSQSERIGEDIQIMQLKGLVQQAWQLN